MVLEKRCRRIVTADELQFDFMSERVTFDAVLILRSLQEMYHAKGKMLCICHMDLEKALDRVTGKVSKWAMRKKGIPEALVRTVMSLYEGAKTRVRVDCELSEVLDVIKKENFISITCYILISIHF